MPETNAKIPDPEKVPWLELWPAVGRDILGLGRTATYGAVLRGEIPVVKVGRKMRVPTARLRELFGMDSRGDAA